MQEDLFFSQVNIVKQISPPLPHWHFQQFSQQLLFSPSPSPSIHSNLSLSCSFHLHPLCESVQLRQALPPPTYCWSAGGRLSARRKSVFSCRRQEAPSLMEGNSYLLSQRGKDISLCISSACVQGNYHSWHPQELKFNLHDLQSLSTPPRKTILSAKGGNDKRTVELGWIHFSRVKPFPCHSTKPKNRTGLETHVTRMITWTIPKSLFLPISMIIQQWEVDRSWKTNETKLRWGTNKGACSFACRTIFEKCTI